MIFASAMPSVVRSIRQRDFLNHWLRLFGRQQSLPSFVDFKPDRIEDELPDLMYYDIRREFGELRYGATFSGTRLIESYGFSATGRDLQDLLHPDVWQHVQPIYDGCIERGLPIYSAFTVIDVAGQQVAYERLVLPFGEDGQVRQMIASIKSISTEGRFINRDLMRAQDHEPNYTVRAVIDQSLKFQAPKPVPAGDVVEI
jgi:hypothetical protein